MPGRNANVLMAVINLMHLSQIIVTRTKLEKYRMEHTEMKEMFNKKQLSDLVVWCIARGFLSETKLDNRSRAVYLTDLGRERMRNSKLNPVQTIIQSNQGTNTTCVAHAVAKLIIGACLNMLNMRPDFNQVLNAVEGLMTLDEARSLGVSPQAFDDKTVKAKMKNRIYNLLMKVLQTPRPLTGIDPSTFLVIVKVKKWLYDAEHLPVPKVIPDGGLHAMALTRWDGDKLLAINSWGGGAEIIVPEEFIVEYYRVKVFLQLQ